MHILAVHCRLGPWGMKNGVQRQIKFLTMVRFGKNHVHGQDFDLLSFL